MILTGDCINSMRKIAPKSVRCCVTSPPYFGLRDYGHDGQIGLEETPGQYVAKMVEVFREVRKVLTDDGTLWLNIGDSYASYRDGKATPDTTRGDSTGTLVPKGSARNRMASTFAGSVVKHKDLIGTPWMLAFALRADGWYLRQDIIWHKPNPMPESVKDRCTKAHEYIFLLSKSPKYYFDADAVKEPSSQPDRAGKIERSFSTSDPKASLRADVGRSVMRTDTRNRRSVWLISTKPFSGAHFAVMPENLVEPCILAGSAIGDTILDPFFGSGTVGVVATRLGRKYVGCELNPKYVEIAKARLAGTQHRLPISA